jgi:hypothetical protein
VHPKRILKASELQVLRETETVLRRMVPSKSPANMGCLTMFPSLRPSDRRIGCPEVDQFPSLESNQPDKEKEKEKVPASPPGTTRLSVPPP